MKLIHLSDLHIGKRVNEFSMMEDQEYILKSLTTKRPTALSLPATFTTSPCRPPRRSSCLTISSCGFPSEICRCISSAATTTHPNGWRLATALWRQAAFIFHRFTTALPSALSWQTNTERRRSICCPSSSRRTSGAFIPMTKSSPTPMRSRLLCVR